jgi:hypothetical protein
MPTVEQYQKHLAAHGDDCLLQTAARDRDLTQSDLMEIKATVEYTHRVYKWHNGAWIAKREGLLESQIRKCAREGCNKDIPVVRSKQAKYCSDSCSDKAYNQRAGR